MNVRIKRLGPGLLLAVICSCGPGENPSYPPVIDRAGQIAGVHTKNLAFLEDPSGNLTLETVRSPGAAWLAHPNVPPTFGYSDSSFWLHFPLENRSDVDCDVILLINSEYIDHFELYGLYTSAPPDSKPVFQKSGGREHPFNARDLLHRKYAYPLKLRANSSYDFYLSLRSGSSLNIPLFVMSRSDYEEIHGQENLRMGLYGGLFVLLLIVTTALYFTLRDRSFLVYLGYLLFSFIYQFSLQGYAYKYLWPNHPVWAGKVNALTFCLAGAMGMLFAAEFLETRTRHPRTNAVMRTAIVCWLLLPVTLLFIPAGKLEDVLAKSLGPFSVGLLYFCGWQAYLGGYKPARFYVLAWTAYIPFTIFYVMQIQGVVANGILGVDMLENLAIGISLEMLIFPFAIGDRLRLALDNGTHQSKINTKAESSTAARSQRLDRADVDRRLREAFEIAKIYRNDLKLNDLAAEIDLNEKDLSSYLNNVLGKSFYTLISEYRVAEAQELLLSRPDEKVITIAHAVGFQSLSTFHSAFQKIVGSSPSEFRKRHGGESSELK